VKATDDGELGSVLEDTGVLDLGSVGEGLSDRLGLSDVEDLGSLIEGGRQEHVRVAREELDPSDEVGVRPLVGVDDLRSGEVEDVDVEVVASGHQRAGALGEVEAVDRLGVLVHVRCCELVGNVLHPYASLVVRVSQQTPVIERHRSYIRAWLGEDGLAGRCR